VAVKLHRGVLGAHDLWLLDTAMAAQLPDFAQAETVYEGSYTRIQRHPNRDALVTKLSWVKTAPRDNLRKYWGCQARREIAANRTLHRLGLATAQLLGYGIPLAPWARFESLLFMRALPAHDTLRVVLRNTADPDQRDALFDHVAADIAAIYRNGYHHKDCHLENVLRLHADKNYASDTDTSATGGDLIWIDNDLRYSTRPARARKRLAGSLQQLVDTSRDFVSRPEWRYFSGSLAQHLRATELGRELAAATVADFRAAFA
jgi:hypothetical protein